MSYYWKKNGTLYHWNLHCSAVPVYVRTDPEWIISEEQPIGKEKCKECREKDVTKRFQGKYPS